MKLEEQQKKLSNKIQAVQTLCNQLQISISAKQMVSKNGLIENIIFYSDSEKYPEEVVLPVEIKEEPKTDVQTPDIQQ